MRLLRLIKRVRVRVRVRDKAVEVNKDTQGLDGEDTLVGYFLTICKAFLG